MAVDSHALEQITTLLGHSRHLVVLTGAGCSTDSGIPEYRDADGQWKHARPVQYADFIKSHAVRQRYWARSMVGWTRMGDAKPNMAHEALARLEQEGLLKQLITQNVDGLHQQAGSREVIDLHGKLAQVVCLECSLRVSRTSLQDQLEHQNPDWISLSATQAPDGDAQLETDFSDFIIPSCPECDGVLKPDVVFFGENVPRQRVERAIQSVNEADIFLVVGSSLMVWSGLRYVRAASERGIPVVLINLGKTRADELFTHRLVQNCGEALTLISKHLFSSDNNAAQTIKQTLQGR